LAQAVAIGVHLFRTAGRQEPATRDDIGYFACRTLTIREAILGGGSSGATVAALSRLAPRIPRGSTCVLVFPDGGDRYLDTIYSDEWVAGHFGEVSHLWKEEEQGDMGR
jgi:cysteine synthase A